MDPTVHLIDNDLGAFEIVCELVGAVGFRVEPHRSPAAFLSGYDARQSGCLVANLGVPGMSGIEFLHELNACEEPIPAVFVASQADAADVVSLMQSGAVSLLEKPYRKRTLLAAIQSAVRLSTERRLVADRRRSIQERLSLLTKGERIVLHGLLSGDTNKRMASRLGIALRTVEYRRHNIFSKLNVQSIAELAATVAELERLTDIGELLQAPAMRLTDSRFSSFCMPMRLRTVSRNRQPLDHSPAGRKTANAAGAPF